MSKRVDLTGRRFGRLTALCDTGERRYEQVVWHCHCDCGNEIDVASGHLISGHTKSCGCYRRELHTVHGMCRHGKRHPVYSAWDAMLKRCENPNNNRYEDYGGRGIKVCAEWHDLVIFVDWALARGWQEGLQIDRIDNNGDYEPGNCRWTTQKEQARNRRSNHLITFNGKTQCLTDWATEHGMNYSTLWQRINMYHWPIERALTEPIRKRCSVI